MKIEIMLKDLFKKVDKFDGDFESEKYEELMDDFIKLKTELFIVLPRIKDKDERQLLRHRAKILEKIFDLKVRRVQSRRIRDLKKQMEKFRIPDKPR